MPKATIMIVEDEWLIADDLRRSLERMDYRVSSISSSAEKAFATIEAERPDLVLMDIILSDAMNGIEAAGKIHDRFKIPHIFITAYGDQAMLEKAKVTEPFGYLLKPFDEKELNAAIEMALYKSSMEAQLRESEKRFKSLVEATSDLIWEVDENAVYTYVSPKIMDVLGYTSDEVLGMKPFDLMPPEEASRVAALFGPIAASHKEFRRLENVNVRKDGTHVILETSGVPLFDRQGTFRGYRGIDRDITVRKRAEELVQKKNKLLENIIESLPHPFFVINAADYSLSLTNSAARRGGNPAATTCYSLSHQREEPCREDNHPCVLEQILLTGSSAIAEHVHHDEQGNPRIVEVHGYPIFDDGGKVAQIIEYNLDITDRKKAERKLKESEERFHGAFQHSAIGIGLVSPEGRWVRVNSALCRIVGYSEEELMNLTFQEITHPDDLEADLDSVHRMMKGEIQTYQMEKRYIHKAGHIVWILLSVSLVRNSDRRPLYFVAQVQDITEQKIWADKLQRQKDTLQKYLDISAVMVVMINRDGNVSLINRKGCEILGYEEDEITGKNWFDNFLPKSTSEEVKSIFFRLMAGEVEPVEYYENPVLTKNGELRMIGWYNTVFRDSQGSIVATLGSGGDITERKEAEQERERLNAELAQKNKEMEQLVYVTSHDLRTPLAIIQGYAREFEITMNQLLAATDEDPVAQKRLTPYLNDMQDTTRYIRSNIQKMDRLLYGLLKLSRSGNIELNKAALDMNRLTDEIRESLAFKIKEAKATVEIADLPSCTGDETQINQVFSNLIGNALKYLAPDRPGVIRISGFGQGGESLYCVEDNGIGIAPADHDRIFNIFYQSNPAASGEGLGLAIVRKILERHGGRIWVESEQGRGSRFYVALPLQ